MTEQHTARVARLFRGKGTSGSGGLLLPEVFREIFTTLLDDGPAPRLVLHKIIRDFLGYKSERVFDIWGSWEAFCDDLLLIEQEEGFLAQEDDFWSLTEKAVPDTQLVVLSDPENPARRIRVTFSSRKDQEVRDAIAEAWRRAGELVRALEPHKDRDPVIGEAYHQAAGISGRLQGMLSAPRRAQPPAQRKRGRGRPAKERDKPAPPDEPQTLRTCIGICGRTMPLTRENFECYWSERMLASGLPKGGWYWRTDCKKCHSAVRHQGASRNKDARKQKKESLRLRIGEISAPYPSMFWFSNDLGMDPSTVRKLWTELHDEGKVPPPPDPPPTYPRPLRRK